MEKHVWKVEPKRSVGPVELGCLRTMQRWHEHTSQELTGEVKSGDINVVVFSTEILFKACGTRQDHRK